MAVGVVGGAGEEGLGERWGVLGDELLGGYGSGCFSSFIFLPPSEVL